MGIMEGKKIIVVENKSTVGIMFKLMLEAKGYTVIDIVSKGEDAISMVETTHPDLLLMDIWLRGDMDGIETAMKIRDLCDIPIIFVTTDHSKEIRKRADLVDHQSYLKKPLRYEDFEKVVHSIFYKSIDKEKEILEEANTTIGNKI